MKSTPALKKFTTGKPLLVDRSKPLLVLAKGLEEKSIYLSIRAREILTHADLPAVSTVSSKERVVIELKKWNGTPLEKIAHGDIVLEDNELLPPDPYEFFSLIQEAFKGGHREVQGLSFICPWKISLSGVSYVLVLRAWEEEAVITALRSDNIPREHAWYIVWTHKLPGERLLSLAA